MNLPQWPVKMKAFCGGEIQAGAIVHACSPRLRVWADWILLGLAFQRALDREEGKC